MSIEHFCAGDLITRVRGNGGGAARRGSLARPAAAAPPHVAVLQVPEWREYPAPLLYTLSTALLAFLSSLDLVDVTDQHLIEEPYKV